jgi:hypothetical protein
VPTSGPLEDLGLDTRRVKSLAFMCPVHSAKYAAELVILNVPLPEMSPDLIRNRFQAKPANLKHWFPYLFVMKQIYGVWYQRGSFFLFNAENTLCMAACFLLAVAFQAISHLFSSSGSPLNKRSLMMYSQPISRASGLSLQFCSPTGEHLRN